MAGHPYNAAYLQEIAETQGVLFERLQDVSPNVDGREFIRAYMKSDTRQFLDRGDVYLATLSPSELMDYYRTEDAHDIKDGRPFRICPQLDWAVLCSISVADRDGEPRHCRSNHSRMA